MFGSHLSIAGGMTNAIAEAERLGMDTVQVFTKNQQQWRVPRLDAGAVRDWRSEIARLGWEARTVSHASYLINLASPNDELWRKSVDLMVEEIERCEALGIPFLVHHPGSSTTSSREEGMARIARAYGELFARTKGYTTVSCLENTVGGGSLIGREFAEIGRLRAMIIETTGDEGRIGVCLDTCHAHAGGYDLSTSHGAREAMEAFEREVGLEHLRVLHVNDSKTPAGSRRDRHEHIGKGTIGPAGFQTVLNWRGVAAKPKILETPKGTSKGGVSLDALNLRQLRRLMEDRGRSMARVSDMLSGVGAASGPAKARKAAKEPVGRRPRRSTGK